MKFSAVSYTARKRYSGKVWLRSEGGASHSLALYIPLDLEMIFNLIIISPYNITNIIDILSAFNLSPYFGN